MTNTTTPVTTLNQGQQNAADGFFEFLFTDAKELIISGTAGVGKTYLLGHLINRVIPDYEKMCSMIGIKQVYHDVVMTATTNKAAEILSNATRRPVQTVHSFLNLLVKEDYQTGRTELRRTSSWVVHTNTIVFVDECSMIDSELRKAILEGTSNCKIIYVGDHLQLPPVLESLSPIYRDNLPFFELTQPMRNSKSPALQALCGQFRRTVETGIFLPIQTDGQDVSFLSPEEAENEVRNTFSCGDVDACVMAYTNATVNAVNEFVRAAKGLPPHFVKGEEAIFNRSMLLSRNASFSAEERVLVLSVENYTSDYAFTGLDGKAHQITTRIHILENHFNQQFQLAVPENKAHLQEYIKYFARLKDWNTYFWLQKTFPDLRPRYASTVHKSQGSTFDTVFVDMADIATCTNAVVAARLLYVAASRPRSKIVFYGNKKTKYGEFIT